MSSADDRGILTAPTHRRRTRAELTAGDGRGGDSSRDHGEENVLDVKSCSFCCFHPYMSSVTRELRLGA